MLELTEALRHREGPRTEYFIELPFEGRTLRLDLLGSAGPALAQAGMSDEATAQAVQRTMEAREELDGGGFERAEAALLAVVRDYPYFAAGYRELYELYADRLNSVEAEFHLKQLVALQPTYQNLTALGRLIGRMGRYDEAQVIQQWLWQTRGSAARPQALTAIADYLVTLSRQTMTGTLITVAAQAIVEYGREANLLYQYLLGLFLDKQLVVVEQQLVAVLDELDGREPLRRQFERLLEAVRSSS